MYIDSVSPIIFLIGYAPWSEFQGVPYYLLTFYAIYRWITAPELLQQLKVCPKMILALSLSGTTLPRRKREESDRWKWKTHFGIVQKEKIYWSLMIRLNWISEFASSSSLLKKSILLTFSIFSGGKKKIPCPLWVKILDNVSLTNFPFMVRWRPWPPFPDFDNFFPIFLCWIFLQKLLWLSQ